MSEPPTVRVSSGQLRGTREDGVDRYLGIPYAAAPVGALRFAAAAPAPAWEGVRDADRMGPTAPQNPYGAATAPYLANIIDPGDEFLNVNVWAPVDARNRPVMVWVHGGSSAHGSNALDGYDGTAFARDGVVFVGINYRLAAEGFSVLDDAPTNLGLADVAAALRWVRAEIAAFGGDPRNVTAFGESAGAIALGQLLASPVAAALFDRVILQSGAPMASTRKEAARITQLTAKQLGIPTTREAFLARTPAELLDADAIVTAKSNALTGGASYAAAIGDELVPRAPLEAVLDGAGDGIPLMVGWTSEEYRLFLVPSGIIERVNAVLFALARVRYKVSRRILRAYQDAHPGASRGVLLGEMLIDHLLRLPFNRMADSRLKARCRADLRLRVRVADQDRRPRRGPRPRDRLRLRPPALAGLDPLRRRGRAAAPRRRDARRVGAVRDDGRSGMARVGCIPPRDGVQRSDVGRRRGSAGCAARGVGTALGAYRLGEVHDVPPCSEFSGAGLDADGRQGAFRHLHLEAPAARSALPLHRGVAERRAVPDVRAVHAEIIHRARSRTRSSPAR